MSAALDNVLSKLNGVRRDGARFKALCPVHSERTGSLDIRDGDHAVLLHCFGCGAEAAQICAALQLDVRELFFDTQANGSKSTKPSNGNGSAGKHAAHQSDPAHLLTLTEFAEAKRLSLDFLREEGLENWPAGGVIIGYFHAGGEQAQRQRLRTALAARDGSTWLGTAGIKPICYGQWHRADDRARSKTGIICEGESDTLVFRHAGYPVLGVPGAQNTSALVADDIEGIDALFVTQDADTAGAKFVAGVRKRVAGFDSRKRSACFNRQGDIRTSPTYGFQTLIWSASVRRWTRL